MTNTFSLPADASAKLIDVNKVAELMDCSARHVYRLSDAGKMPAPFKLGALVRWSVATINEWVAAGCPAVRHITAQGAKR
jgi:excisionase family DNA binding protein